MSKRSIRKKRHLDEAQVKAPTKPTRKIWTREVARNALKARLGDNQISAMWERGQDKYYGNSLEDRLRLYKPRKRKRSTHRGNYLKPVSGIGS